ncbi:MAG: hypothetical protein GX444_13865 [Myxococcales bacterium]|nr:hypothetical protein [Myxococcales bacterium]
MNTKRLRLDRIASATRNAGLAWEITVGDELVAREGHVVAVRILNNKYTYNTVEDVTGRMLPLRQGDLLAGVLGSRRALRGYAGVVPSQIRVGDVLHVLNLGGVLGTCTAANPELGPPFDAEVLGAVLAFPRYGDRVGVPAHIMHKAIQHSPTLTARRPVVYISGTCMNSGKTLAASEIIRRLTHRGLKVAGCKMTGVSLMRDTLGMQDAGAFAVASFNEAGLASTRDAEVVPVAKGLLNHLAALAPDVIVAELGDGILGEYGVADLLRDAELMSLACCHVLCAPDPVAAFGAHHLFANEFRLPLHVIAGPVTDNAVGRDYIEKALGLPAHNARYDIDGLAGVVIDRLDAWEDRG